MGSAEFTRWMAYYELHPDASMEVREYKADYRMAIQASVSWLLAVALSGGKAKAREPEDFLPKWRVGRESPDTPEALGAKVEALRGIFGRSTLVRDGNKMVPAKVSK